MSDTKRKIFIVIILLLVILFGVGQFFAGAGLNTTGQQATQNSTSSNSLITQVINYVPGAAMLATSTPIAKGSCFASSVAAPYRTDAWRCTVGNAISDPCFEIPSPNGSQVTGVGAQLLCGANPAGTSVSSTFILQLTKALPKAEIPPAVASGTVPSNWAWLVELADGTICSPFTGTRPFTSAGDVAIYSCNGGISGEEMIFGNLSNVSTTWTAEVGSLSTSTKIFPPVIVASATIPVFAVWQ